MRYSRTAWNMIHHLFVFRFKLLFIKEFFNCSLESGVFLFGNRELFPIRHDDLETEYLLNMYRIDKILQMTTQKYIGVLFLKLIG